MARKNRKYGANGEGLSLTSMMDMFTIVLVFLIKQVDSEGNLLTQAENLKLPISTSLKTSKEIALTVVVDSKQILVDNEAVAETPAVAKQDSLMIASMIPALEKKREEEKKSALAKGDEPDQAGNVIVQLDKNTSYDVMYKVMASCGWAGYTNIAFAVIMKNAE
jgi:biopolymer transport protein ExbD